MKPVNPATSGKARVGAAWGIKTGLVTGLATGRPPRYPKEKPPKESAFWRKTIKPNLSPRVHAFRIENDAVAGCPDLNLYRSGDGDVWVEMKIQREGRIEVRNSQLIWMRERILRGARNIFYCAMDNKHNLIVWRGTTIFHHLNRILAGAVPEKDYKIHVLKKSTTFKVPLPDQIFPAPYNWPAFESYLFGKLDCSGHKEV